MQSQIIINIENVVATAEINQTLNLKRIVKKISEVQYRPEKFPGVIMRLKSPKAVILFFYGQIGLHRHNINREDKKSIKRIYKNTQNAYCR